MERKESSSTINSEERIPPQARVTTSRLNIHGEETLIQGPGGIELTDAFKLDNIRSQSMLESGRGKQAGPAIESYVNGLGPPASFAPKALQPQRNKECEPQEDPKVKRSQSFPLKESRSEDLQANRSLPSNEYYAIIESENKQLRKQLADYKAACSSSQKSLAESKARGAQLHERLEEATATIFRLRPQRQEHTESEIQGDFYRLSESIKNWIEMNCDGFLEDDHHGFEMMLNRSMDGNPGVETILKRFQHKARDLIELKEHVLAAIVMRYLFDGILNRPLSILLKKEEESLLTDIYESMATMDPPKDLPTRRTWKSDTATAIDIHPGFASRYREIENRQTTDLYLCLQNVLSRDHKSADAVNSIYKGIVAPAIALARKIQSASSIWEFKYSEWCDCQPGELMAKIPNFLAMIEDYRCINLSACAKQLKPATDLVRPDQQRRIAYVLDIFPGLYCQRMTPAGSQPRTTVSQPVLIVSFVPEVSRNRTDSSDPITMMDGEKSVPLPVNLQYHRSIDTERRVMNDSQAPPPIAPRSHSAEDADGRTANNSQRIWGPQTHSQSPQYRKEVINSRGGAQESRRPQPPHPAPQRGSLIGAFKSYF